MNISPVHHHHNIIHNAEDRQQSHLDNYRDTTHPIQRQSTSTPPPPILKYLRLQDMVFAGCFHLAPEYIQEESMYISLETLNRSIRYLCGQTLESIPFEFDFIIPTSKDSFLWSIRLEHICPFGHLCDVAKCRALHI